MNVRQERHLIERVIHLLRILEENGIESESTVWRVFRKSCFIRRSWRAYRILLSFFVFWKRFLEAS